MLKIEKFVTMSPEQWEMVIEGTRNPKNSWAKMDSEFLYTDPYSGELPYEYSLGDNDHKLLMNLAKGGPVEAKYRRMMPVWVTVIAPLYWWKEYDTYKVGTVANSCSTMHKIQEKEFTLDDFSHEHLTDDYSLEDELTYTDGLNDDIYCYTSLEGLRVICDILNHNRLMFLATKNKKYWWQMIQLLPSSYNQKRTLFLNYEVLCNIYHSRKNHKLDEWHVFCDWIKELPYSELITGEQ